MSATKKARAKAKLKRATAKAARKVVDESETVAEAETARKQTQLLRR